MINKISLNHLRNLAFLSSVWAVLLAGCGGGGSADTSPGTGPAATVPDPMYKQQILGSTQGSYGLTCQDAGAQNANRVLQISGGEISLNGKKTLSANTDDAIISLDRRFTPTPSKSADLTLYASNKSISFMVTFTPSGANDYNLTGFRYFDLNTNASTTCVPTTTATLSYVSTSLPKQLFTNETGSIPCTNSAVGPALYDYVLTRESLTLSSGQDRVVFNLGAFKDGERFDAQNDINPAGISVGKFMYASGLGNQNFSIVKYADSGVSQVSLRQFDGSVIKCQK